MIGKVKQGLSSFKDEYERKKQIKEQIKLAEEEEELRQKQEQNAKEQRILEAERTKLLQMNEKELAAELIFAVRGFYAEFQALKESQIEIEEALKNVKARLSALEMHVDDLQIKIDSVNINSEI